VYFDRNVPVPTPEKPWAQVLRPFVIACDTYRKVRWNLRAIGATVEALRAIQRHGASSMLEQAFTGFAALPPANRAKPWHEVLGVAETAAAEAVRDAYRELARIHHPDAGGNAERMAEINGAFDEWRRLEHARST
jgi:DnaJ-domain-containing protein 1